MIKRVFTFFVASQVVLSSMAAMASSKVDRAIGDFISYYASSEFAYELSKEDFEKAWAENDVRGVYQAQVQKTLRELSNFSKEELEARISKKEELREKADDIVHSLLKRPLVEINETLLALLHRYLFEPNTRDPLKYIFDSLTAYKFSPEQIRQLAKEDHRLYQYTTGSTYSLLTAFGILAVLKYKKLTPAETLNLMKVGLSDLATSSKSFFNKTASAKAGAQTKKTNDFTAILSELHEARASLRSLDPSLPELTKPGAEAARDLTKRKFLLSAEKILQRPIFQSLLYATGISVVGGVGNVIVNAATPGAYAGDEVIDVTKIQNDYFDGLAALRLSCNSHDLLSTVSTASAVSAAGDRDVNNLKAELAQQLNELYTEYAVLKRLTNLRFNETVILPAEITFDIGSKHVHFNLNVKGETIKKDFSCDKLAEVERQNPIQVNLLEVLDELTQVFVHLRD